MTVAYWCVVAAAILPYALALAWRVRHPAYTLAANRAPRALAERLGRWHQRAHWAHLNGLEAFAPFAAAVILAQQIGAPQARIDALALAFISFRLAHAGFYLADWGVPRSLAFAAGLACTVGLFLSGL